MSAAGAGDLDEEKAVDDAVIKFLGKSLVKWCRYCYHNICIGDVIPKSFRTLGIALMTGTGF